MLTRKTVITCAVTGSGNTVQKSDKVPVTPAQIAESCLRAAQAGAAVVHIHVRDPRTGSGSRELSLYRETVERIRSVNPEVCINLTTGMGGDWAPSTRNPMMGTADSDMISPQDRISHIEVLRPDLCSLDCGSMNFGEMVFVNTKDHVQTMARCIAELGVKQELELFELGHVRLANYLMQQGLIGSPPLCQVCLGVPWGAPATPEAMMALVHGLPPGAVWSAFGVGRDQFPMVAQAYLLGGHVRVGLEDNLYLSKGRLATNEELVERAVRIVESLGGEIASPAEARAIFGLAPRNP